ncbi:MAG TPA: translation initiation factor eIF-1A [Candidatus Thalassarchaeaceae archaeon]|nr:translation initiation factor eIF-1A [Euryarchaeota archaeon]DAC44718.1 MAG TPA: translation initiation factor eIF-1A [Candidatus Poseidoniales archaeon]HII34652.1 translation initiation factor eIF-1A [Candidatus Thalassarchaeaceae archaeon]
MARREEKVDFERLAQLESGSGDRIRVPLPNRKVNEMFAIADEILGGRRIRAVCEDGLSRISRIPGKMRRRQWVREGDLIVIQPWDFQDEKANVCMRYTKTQSLYLSRKGALPEIVDLFGLSGDRTNVEEEDFSENVDDEIQEAADSNKETIEKPRNTSSSSNDEDDIDSFFG